MNAEEYRKMAEVEDRMWYYRALHGHIIEVLRVPVNRETPMLLDAGCGTGGLLRSLYHAYPGWSFTGLDISQVACGLARERTKAAIVDGSVMALPFPDAMFDIIVSCDVLCQVPDAAKAILEFKRCLKPDGIMAITLPAYQWMYSYHDKATANLRRYTRTEINSLFSDAGMNILTNTYWNMLPFPFAVIRRKIFPPEEPNSDVNLFPAPVEAVFNSLMALEKKWLQHNGRLPFGCSTLAVAKKSKNDFNTRRT